jgi:hypothetical protein
MNSMFTKKLRLLTLVPIVIILLTGSSFALDLAAVEAEWTPPGSVTPITMWGFVLDTGDCPAAPVSWDVGTPMIAALETTLTINLRNCLSEAVSIVIPGQNATLNPQTFTDPQGRTRVKAFTTETVSGATQAYVWNNLKAGTYLYQSGSHPAKQVQMGLYGALTVGTYPNTGGDVTLLYSEIDPALHDPPSTATPLGYNPKYFLVNGSATQPTLSAGDTSQPTVLRFLNAGLDFHVPALNSSYMMLVAEDGNPYPFVREQYSVLLPAGKTIDALWNPSAAGTYIIYDRQLSGVYASLTVLEPCEGDFDGDGDVDGSDLSVFSADFGRTDCGVPTTCPGDFDNDGDVDGSDLAVFAADFGRTDCP